METPWSSYQTAEPQPFIYGQGDRILNVIIGSGSEAVACSAQINVLYIVEANGTITPMMKRGYRLPLEAWPGGGAPRIYMHPFALLNMAVTSQLPEYLILRILREGFDGQHSSVEHTVEYMDCRLLQRLRSSSVTLHISTIWDFEVV